MAYKVRLKFSKTDNMRFIGHLDLLTLFQRAVNRAGLPIAYSQGFNPHQIMSFAMPLSVGMSSVWEVVDIALEVEMPLEELQSRLNGALPKGITILGCKPIVTGEKSSAALLCAARYMLAFPEACLDEAFIEAMLKETEICIQKRTKTKNEVMNIRPDILGLTYCSPTTLQALLTAGSSQSLKPELLVQTITQRLNVPYVPYGVTISRIEMLKNENNRLVPLE